MKNLKRALSLVLATVMVIGMMVVGASAAGYNDLTDKDEIVNKEAVAMVAELGLIVGYDGKFMPNGTIDRAGMAKLICLALNGGKDPILGTQDTPTYTDTKGHWAEGYIDYCSALGIINGDGAGKFYPNAAVTGTGAAKMLLTALGYKSEVEGFIGDTWEINTNVKANQVKLYEGLESMNASANLTRDNAAQMVYNALNAREVFYTNAVVVNGVVIGNSQLVPHDYTMLANRFGVHKHTGVLTANDTYGFNTTAGRGYTRISLAEIDGVEQARITTQQYKTVADSELLGQEVNIFVKRVNGKDVVVGQPVATTNNTVLSTFDGMDADDVIDYLDDNGLVLADNVAYYIDNVPSGAAITNDAGDKFVAIDNDADGEVEVVMVTNYTMTTVTYKDAVRENLALAVKGTISAANIVTGYEDAATGDVVLYTLKNGKYEISAVETFEGVMTKYYAPTASGQSATFVVNGETYSISEIGTEGLSQVVATDATVAGLGFKSNNRFYMDAAGNVRAHEPITVVGNYALVLDSGAATSAYMNGEGTEYTAHVKLLLADGTVETYPVNLLATANKYVGKTLVINGSDNTITTGMSSTAKTQMMARYLANNLNTTVTPNQIDCIQKTIVTYTVGEDGKVTLAPTTAYAHENDGTSAWTFSGPGVPNGNGQAMATGVTYWTNAIDGGFVLNSSTKFFAFDGTSTQVITGIQNIPGYTAGQVISFHADPTTRVIKAVYVNVVSGAASKYIYVTSNASVVPTASGSKYQYTGVFADGTVETFISNDYFTKTQLDTNGRVFNYTPDAAGYVDLAQQGTYTTIPVLNAFNTPGDPDYNKTTFKGYVSAIDIEAVTITDASGNKISIDNTGLNVWNVTGAPAAGVMVPGNQVVVSFTTIGNDVVVSAVYVTKANAATNAVYVNGALFGYYATGATVTVPVEANDWYFTNTDGARVSNTATQADATGLVTLPTITGNVWLFEAKAVTITGTHTAVVGTTPIVAGNNIVAEGTTIRVTASAANTPLTFTNAASVTTIVAPATGVTAVYDVVVGNADLTIA